MPDGSWRRYKSTFPNVLITAHQGFFTEDAMREIAETTAENATAFERGEPFHRVTSTTSGDGSQ